MQLNEIKRQIAPILTKYQVKRASVFGSVARNQAHAFSDIDLLIELGTNMGLLKFIGLKQELEDILGKKVDLVEYQALKPRLRAQILAEEIQIYG